jgi:hypothetical protein
MQTSDYESMVTAQANPSLPGERLGSLGRSYGAKTEYLLPGLIAFAGVAYHTYTTSGGDFVDYAAVFAALAAGGLLTQAFY